LISGGEDTVASAFENTFLCSKYGNEQIYGLVEAQSRLMDFALKKFLKLFGFAWNRK